MEQHLISKKDLLARYAISYGALYRWKRKGLIPEEWFLKKSTVTGQETFFPEALICERVELIREQKDEHSLDDLSKQLRKKNKSQAVLVLKTVYGEKSFYENEILSVCFDEGNGIRRDITNETLGRESL